MIDWGVVIFHTGVVFGLKIKSPTFISLYTVKSCKVKPRQKEISLIGSRSAKKNPSPFNSSSLLGLAVLKKNTF